MQVFRHIPPHATKPAALTIGNFDGVHLGHRAVINKLLEQSREQWLAPGVLTFEPHPREFFTPQLAPARLTSLREKLEMLEELGVERVYLCRFDQAFAAMAAQAFVNDILRRLDTRMIFVGKDFRFGADREGDIATLVRAGIEVESVPNVTVDKMRVSSTTIRKALTQGDLAQAARLLGRPYSLSGHVTHGDKLGRELGYPTANIHMLHNRPPLAGIYAVKLSGIAETALPGVASLGVRPTTKENGKPTLEVHLFDFDRNIYGRHVRVSFLKKLRDEEKFPSLEALKRQIANDEKMARDFLKENYDD
ncbi:MAG: bifunctional riboflavin kinase/FAD synthetase [Methylobacillus sp.]|jgi:riboflavin kinase/FMN adenylyltransferase|nr:bifunctional riboflavin kinase/FAD synthetase [Methylobacillus sp.]